MSWTMELAARMYGVELFDYGDGREGTLIASGSGLAMAIMDSTRLRWCIDIDAMRGERVAYRVAQFAEMAAKLSGGSVFAGWYSLTGSSETMARAYHHVVASGGDAIWYEGGADEEQDLWSFLDLINTWDDA